MVKIGGINQVQRERGHFQLSDLGVAAQTVQAMKLVLRCCQVKKVRITQERNPVSMNSEAASYGVAMVCHSCAQAACENLQPVQGCFSMICGLQGTQAASRLAVPLHEREFAISWGPDLSHTPCHGREGRYRSATCSAWPSTFWRRCGLVFRSECCYITRL